MGIFQEFAPFYWEAGLPVMPLKRWNSIGKGAGKAPILSEWTAYGSVMPSLAMQESWRGTYKDSNIGLPFGEASGLCAIDIDTEDEEQIAAILSALPPSPWKRVGKKGMGLIYKWQSQANFKLRDGDNNSIVEFLGKGNQMVMPPSIHPDTGRPYVSDTNLWEVLNKIQVLPLDIERVLRQALGNVPGLSIAQTGRSAPLDVVPQGERDIQMVRHAGYLARVVLGIDKNERFTLQEAMAHMSHWVESFTAHTAGGDDMDPDKGVAKLVEFLLKDVEGGRTLPTGWEAGLTPEQLAHPAIAKMVEMNATQRWTTEKALDWMTVNFAIDPDNPAYLLEKVWELIDSTAKDENFLEREFKMVAQAIKDTIGKKVSMSKPDLVTAFKEARRGDVEQATDHEAIARQVVDEIERGGEIRFDQGLFWQWGGAHFVGKDEDDIYMEVAASVKGNQLARRHNDYVSVVKTMSKMIRKPLAQELEDGINFANGFLDSDLKLHDHSPKYGKTFTLPFNYVPERATEAHKWLEYLERSWGDDEDYTDKMLALQEAFAATMFGVATKFQRAFLLHGKAGTGKTQALEVLRAMMPPAAQCSVQPSVWAERFQLMPMVGKTLNICGELPESGTMDGRAFKEIIEGTQQNTEYKGGAIFDFKPMAAQWFGSNFLPRSRDTSKGFTRRWLIFEFNRVVPLKEKVIDFHKVLVAEEREAIAAWAVEGLKRLMTQRDYTQPKSHLKRINQVTRANNSVAAFLQSSDKVYAKEGCSANAQNVFDQYCAFMKDISRGYSVSYERFTQILDEMGHECVPYTDGVGAMRYEIKDVELRQAILPTKRPG